MSWEFVCGKVSLDDRSGRSSVDSLVFNVHVLSTYFPKLLVAPLRAARRNRARQERGVGTPNIVPRTETLRNRRIDLGMGSLEDVLDKHLDPLAGLALAKLSNRPGRWRGILRPSLTTRRSSDWKRDPDPHRALSLATMNLDVRPTPRAHELVSRAASAAAAARSDSFIPKLAGA